MTKTCATVPSRPIVVNCPNFDENSGGSIVLHYLVDRLRALGVEAYAFPIGGSQASLAEVKMFYDPDMPNWRRNLKAWNRHRKMKRPPRPEEFQTHPSMDVPIASGEIVKRSIVVYPEIVSGNPLQAAHVVRWLLHRPGFFGDRTEFAPDEYLFYYQKAFAQGVEGVDDDALLRIRWLRDDLYFDRKLGGRVGACRMIRKGNRTDIEEIPEGNDAIPLDGKTHQEIAEIFNRTKRFYCHDPYTMYTFYAALCGCLPIIVPQPGVTFKDLRPLEEERWGIAYGSENIKWAQETRHLMIERFSRERVRQAEMIESFVSALAERFS